ncbi:MAG TPA: efflux RND transporter periplasmic adaptor subunit [Victivallales bacterium]|nr:efflux RND transporter periplasmic adaptor subunit [Victivallales bacterium]
MKIKCRFSAIFISTFLLLLTGCTDSVTNNNSTVMHVQTENAIRKNIPFSISTFGNLSAYKSVDIKAQVSGEIEEVYFDEGAYVKKGQLLFKIDSKPYRATLRVDTSQYEQDISDLKLQKYILYKDKKLAATGNMSKQAYQKLLTGVQMAEAKLESDIARIDLDKINIEYCSVKSPINGILGIYKMNAGNIISTSDVLGNIKSIAPLYVDFAIPENDYFKIKKIFNAEHSVKVSVSVGENTKDDSTKQIIYDGYLKFLNNTANRLSGTVSLRAVIPNQKMQLLPGMFVNVKIQLGMRKNAVLVPKNGVQSDGSGRFLYIVSEENKALIKNIKIDGSYKKYYVLISGNVKSGDKIITTNLMNVSSGVQVRIENGRNK